MFFLEILFILILNNLKNCFSKILTGVFKTTRLKSITLLQLRHLTMQIVRTYVVVSPIHIYVDLFFNNLNFDYQEFNL